MRNSLFDVMITICAGILGYIFSILEYPVPPVLLGIILGPLVESNLGRTMLISHGDLTIFVKRPISIFFIIIIIATIGSNIRKVVKARKQGKTLDGMNIS
jgi:putative tricarboxylic transport membrane protein